MVTPDPFIVELRRLEDRLHSFGMSFEYFDCYNDPDCTFEKPKYASLVKYLNEGALDVIHFLNHVNRMRCHYENKWGGELAPCPFCGNVNVYIQDLTCSHKPEFGVCCDNCEVSMKYFSSKEEARRHWNTRNMFEYHNVIAGWDTEEELPDPRLKFAMWPFSRIIEHVRRFPYYRDSETGEKQYLGMDPQMKTGVTLTELEEVSRLLDIEKDKVAVLEKKLREYYANHFDDALRLLALEGELSDLKQQQQKEKT